MAPRPIKPKLLKSAESVMVFDGFETCLSALVVSLVLSLYMCSKRMKGKDSLMAKMPCATSYESNAVG